MFTYDEYEEGISNTNSHIYNWLKSINEKSTVIFVDFNRFGFINELKYFLKYVCKKQKHEILSSSIFHKLIKINDHNFVYKGTGYKKLFKYINKNETKKIEIWSFNPFIKKYEIKNDNTNKYFYTIDDWRKNKVFEKYSEFLNQRYLKIPSQFDKIFVNNESLKHKLYSNQDNIYFIPNGVDIKHYKNFNQTNDEVIKKIDNKIDNTSAQIIGYLGVISQDRVDFELCEYLIKSNPNLLFIFAGPVLPKFNSHLLESKYNNVKFIGTVYFNEHPYLLSKYDVCIIPHKLNDFTQSMDPKKLYEYLAAGKPIISTPVFGTEKFKSFINIASSKEKFSKFINTALMNDDKQKIAGRQDIVSKHDWKYRFKEIESIISN